MIEDAFWHKDLKVWTLPFKIENYIKLKSLFENDQIKFEADIIAFFEEKATKLEVRIEIEGKKIIIYIPKNEAFINFIRGFNYLKWDKELKAWSVPNYSDNLDKILAFFGW